MSYKSLITISITALAILAHVDTFATQVRASDEQSQSFTPASASNDSGFMAPNIVSADKNVRISKPAVQKPVPAAPVAVSTPADANAGIAPSLAKPGSPEKQATNESAKPSYPQCSSRLADVKAMMQDTLGLNMLDKIWIEDVQKFGGKSRIKVYGTDPIIVEMFGGDGQSIGTTKVTACVNNGKLTAHIKMAGLNFGILAGPALQAQLAVAQKGNTSELIMDISKADNGKVRIADRMTMFEKRIDSTFTPTAAR